MTVSGVDDPTFEAFAAELGASGDRTRVRSAVVRLAGAYRLRIPIDVLADLVALASTDTAPSEADLRELLSLVLDGASARPRVRGVMETP